MASEWETYEIGEIADVVGGGTPSTKDAANFDGGIPWLTPKDLSLPHGRYVSGGERTISDEGLRRSSARLMPAGTVLLSTRAPVGYVAIAAGEITTNQGFRSLVLKDGFLPEFVYYWLLQNTEELERHASGSTFRELSGSALKRIKIRIPPLAEQRAIAHILGTLDDKIELNRRMVRTLEEMARALFKAWFVDFEPVRAKMDGRWRPGESLPGLPAHLYDLFPDRLVDSELGPIPEGWGHVSVYEACDVVYGAPFKSALFNDCGEGVPLLRIRDLATHDPGVYTPEVHPRGYLVTPGDLVVGMDGEFRAHLWHGPKAWLNQRVCCFKPKEGVPRTFLHYSIEELLAFFERAKTGTTVIHLGKSDIDTFRLLYPTDPVLEAFGAVARPIDSRIVVAAQEARVAAQMRDALLPRLVSGDLRVTDPDRILAELG